MLFVLSTCTQAGLTAGRMSPSRCDGKRWNARRSPFKPPSDSSCAVAGHTQTDCSRRASPVLRLRQGWRDCCVVIGGRTELHAFLRTPRTSGTGRTRLQALNRGTRNAVEWLPILRAPASLMSACGHEASTPATGEGVPPWRDTPQSRSDLIGRGGRIQKIVKGKSDGRQRTWTDIEGHPVDADGCGFCG